MSDVLRHRIQLFQLFRQQIVAAIVRLHKVGIFQPPSNHPPYFRMNFCTPHRVCPTAGLSMKVHTVFGQAQRFADFSRKTLVAYQLFSFVGVGVFMVPQYAALPSYRSRMAFGIGRLKC
ncbi:hypothetical protein [Roseovarius aestuariivivens]|uniref:hypothetical protein n=1 Tax=Roseovarius aestuariivivens TaxID=1888910 RepID=UPI001080A500|nr:hypothetical protein [Roseovarius aestuariivivens]